MFHKGHDGVIRCHFSLKAITNSIYQLHGTGIANLSSYNTKVAQIGWFISDNLRIY
jgi:hypothetical protein